MAGVPGRGGGGEQRSAFATEAEPRYKRRSERQAELIETSRRTEDMLKFLLLTVLATTGKRHSHARRASASARPNSALVQKKMMTLENALLFSLVLSPFVLPSAGWPGAPAQVPGGYASQSGWRRGGHPQLLALAGKHRLLGL